MFPTAFHHARRRAESVFLLNEWPVTTGTCRQFGALSDFQTESSFQILAFTPAFTGLGKSQHTQTKFGDRPC
jgi:hypothetical protein